MFQREKNDQYVYTLSKSKTCFQAEMQMIKIHPQVTIILDQKVAGKILFLIEQVIHVSRVQNMHLPWY